MIHRPRALHGLVILVGLFALSLSAALGRSAAREPSTGGLLTPTASPQFGSAAYLPFAINNGGSGVAPTPTSWPTAAPTLTATPTTSATPTGIPATPTSGSPTASPTAAAAIDCRYQ